MSDLMGVGACIRNDKVEGPYKNGGYLKFIEIAQYPNQKYKIF